MRFGTEKRSEMADFDMANKYPKYTWVGNRISESDMEKLYHLKLQTKKPITVLVAEAVKQYLEWLQGGKHED